MTPYLLHLIYAIGLQWFVFQYRYMGWVKLLLSKFRLGQILSECVYCQTIEASAVVYLLMPQGTIQEMVLACLANGLIGLVISQWLKELP